MSFVKISFFKPTKILLNIGYYWLGFYWHYFQVNKEHQFKENTKLSDVITLYNLDANLRSLLMNIINQIEINFRTKLIYWVSNEYKESPTWFADTHIVERNEDRHNLKSCIKVIFYLLGTFAPESRIMYEKKFGSYISKIIDNNDVIKQILKRGLI